LSNREEEGDLQINSFFGDQFCENSAKVMDDSYLNKECPAEAV
jgi:hypothetical protein